jgi:hypothetical protein
MKNLPQRHRDTERKKKKKNLHRDTEKMRRIRRKRNTYNLHRDTERMRRERTFSGE